MIYLPAIVSVTCYFERRRAFATGIAVCGSGICSALFAPLTDWLIEIYGWKGAMVIISALILNCCVFGALLRPLEESVEAADSSMGLVEEGDHEAELLENNHNGCCEKRPILGNGVILTSRSAIDKESLVCLNDSKTEMIEKEGIMTPSIILEYSTSSKSYVNVLDQGTPQQSPSRHSFCAFKMSSQSEEEEDEEDPQKEEKPFYTSLDQVSPKAIRNGLSSCPAATHLTMDDRKASYLFDRKDIFYSRSLMNLPEYRSNPALYSASITTINEHTLDGLGELRRPRTICCCPEEILDTFGEMMDFKILANPTFLLFAVSNFITNLGYYVPYIYLKDKAVDMGIATDKEASSLLAIIGIGSTLGRVVFGYLSDHSFVNRLWLYNVCLTICGLSTIMSSFAPSYLYLTIYAAVFGITCGTYVSLSSVILVDLLGLEKLTNAFGILLLFQGASCLIGPPIIGIRKQLLNCAFF